MPWALQCRSETQLRGKTGHLLVGWMGSGVFATRAEARAHCEKDFGYIRNRPDLQAEPHGWKTPKVVKVRIRIEVVQ